MTSTAIKPISKLHSLQGGQVCPTREIPIMHKGSSLLIPCRSKMQELILLGAARPGNYVMAIALDTLKEEMRKSLTRSREWT